MPANLFDVPIDRKADDLFNFEGVVETLTIRLLARNRPDTDTVALYGPWGSGKSSILRLVKRRCASEAVWIDFDAMRYQAHGDVVLPLLHHVAETAPVAVKPLATKILHSVVNAVRDYVVDQVPGGKIVQSACTDVANTLAHMNEHELPPSPSSVIERRFRELVALHSGTDRKRVVVAIDNLDRCQPAAVLKVVEAIHLVLNVPSVAFVVAVDQDALIRFVNGRYEGTNNEAALYLEKVFPDYYRVPQPEVWTRFSDNDSIKRYLVALTNNDECRRIAQYVKPLWSIISYSHALKNPRRIKRIVRRLSGLARAAWDPEGMTFPGLFFLVALSDIWPHIYRAFHFADPYEWKDMIDSIVLDDAHAVSDDEEAGDDDGDEDGDDVHETEEDDEELSATSRKLRSFAEDEAFSEFVVATCQCLSSSEEWDPDLYRRSIIWQHGKLWDLLGHIRKVGL